MSTILANKIVAAELLNANVWADDDMTEPDKALPLLEFNPPVQNHTIYLNDKELGTGGMATRGQTIARDGGTQSIKMKGYYEHIVPFFYGIGTDYTYALAETGAHRHTMKVLKDISEVTETIITNFAWTEGNETKVNTGIETDFTIEPGDSGVDLTVNYITSPISIATGFNLLGATQLESTDIAKWRTAEFLMNSHSGGALSGSDELELTNITLNFKRGYTEQPRQSGQDYPSLPLETTTPEISFTAVFKTKTAANTAFFNAHYNNTYYKAKLTFTGDLIGATQHNKIEVFFPKLIITEGVGYAMESPTPVTVKFMAISDATPTGMASPMPYFIVTNEAADYNFS
jgi:hypothetical protein